jgi:hypothetical protein
MHRLPPLVVLAVTALACATTPPVAMIRPEVDARSTLERRLAESDATAVVQVESAEQPVGAHRSLVALQLVTPGFGALPAHLTMLYRAGLNTNPVAVGSRWMVFLRAPLSADGQEFEGAAGAWRAVDDGPGIACGDGGLATGESLSRALDMAATEASLRARFADDAAAVSSGRRPLENVRIMFHYGDGDGGYTDLGCNGRLEATGYRQPRTRALPRTETARITALSLEETVAWLDTAHYAALQRPGPESIPEGAVLVVVNLGTGAESIKRFTSAELAGLGRVGELFERLRTATKMPKPNAPE